MVDLNDSLFFVKIVDCGRFTAASRARRSQVDPEPADDAARAGGDFYRHAVAVLREADMAQLAVRQRLVEPSGTLRCTTGGAALQFGFSDIIASFLAKHSKVSVFRACHRSNSSTS
jgi:DNA-binding transcriptional LysR family regulator